MSCRWERWGNWSCCALLVSLAGLLLLASSRATADMATGNAAAIIELPVTVTRAVDLSFGQLVPTASAATITAVPAVTTAANQPVAAAFTVNGGNNAAFSLALPTAVVATNGHDTLLVDGFSANISHTGTSAQSQCTVRVGAQLHLQPGQAAGAYTNTFNVTVAYD